MKKIIAFYCFQLLCTAVVGQDANPFDLYRDSIEVKVDSPIVDSATVEEPYINNSIEDSESIVSATTLAVQTSTKNPFEVESTREDIIKKPIFRSLEKTAKRSQDATKTSETFLFWFLLLALLLMTLGISRDRKSFSNLYKLISNNNYLKLVNRDLNGGKMVFYVLLYAVFFISLSLFIYQYVAQNHSVNGIGFFIRVFALVLFVYLIRHTAMYLASQFTLTTQLLSDYNFLIVISNILCGLLLFPVVILISYSPFQNTFLTIGLLTIAVCYLLRQVNGTVTALKDKQANLFHFFIYICTFEIAPALIIIKLIKSYSGAM